MWCVTVDPEVFVRSLVHIFAQDHHHRIQVAPSAMSPTSEWMRRHIKSLSALPKRLMHSTNPDSPPSAVELSTSSPDLPSTSKTQPSCGAWLPYDVLILIFENLNPTNTRDKLTCVRASRVCRAWAEPASAVLWRHLPTMLPLWNVLCNFSLPAWSPEKSGVEGASRLMAHSGYANIAEEVGSLMPRRHPLY